MLEGTDDQFTCVIPKNWKGDRRDTQVWFPSTEDGDRPLPPHSFHYGARPLLGIPSFENGIETHIGGKPEINEATKRGNIQGFICKWQQRDYNNIGLFLLETGGVDIMCFFHLSGPCKFVWSIRTNVPGHSGQRIFEIAHKESLGIDRVSGYRRPGSVLSIHTVRPVCVPSPDSSM